MMSKLPLSNSRLAALNMLQSVLDSGTNLGDADTVAAMEDGRDRAFARHLAYGVLRWLTALEWLAGHLLKKPLRQKDRDVQLLILMGLFQLWKGDAAAHAAIHESVECARKIGKTWAVGVVNAVLRRFQREQRELIDKLAGCDEHYAHPPWLLNVLRSDWPQDWQRIVEANNQPGPLWVRLNRNFNAEKTLQALRQGGFDAARHPLVRDAVKISPATGVNTLPGFEQGWLSVQDPAAQLAAGLLKVKAGSRVLDACAAPGGKTCHLLETEPNLELTVLDHSATRLKNVGENLLRLGFGNDSRIKLLAENAAKPDEWWDQKPFDRILLDAPCSATGVIRRHPEIKWLRNPGQVDEAAKQQRVLLDQVWPLLKPGGILLYATCSVIKAENSMQMEHFVASHPDAEPMEIEASWGQSLGVGRQILPGEQEMDGFFYASLSKKA